MRTVLVCGLFLVMLLTPALSSNASAQITNSVAARRQHPGVGFFHHRTGHLHR